MGKAGRWLKSLLTGRKEKAGAFSPPLAFPSPAAPKEKKRWSFRRASGARRSLHSSDLAMSAPLHGFSEHESDRKKRAMPAAVGTAVAADPKQAAAAVIRLTGTGTSREDDAVEEASAVKIQAAFRGHLARKALRALQGLVKLQALVRRHLVRKQATATLRSMQALVTAQARIRAQRLRMVEESQVAVPQRQPIHRRSPQHPRPRQSYSYDTGKRADENVKIVEMDHGAPSGSGKSRNSYSVMQTERNDQYRGHHHANSRSEQFSLLSPAPSALTEMSPRAYNGHLEDFSFPTAQSSHYYYMSAVASAADSLEYPFFPNYMANTESSRAKARSKVHQGNELMHMKDKQAGGGHQWKEGSSKEVLKCNDHLHM